jgi:hypothetical protein
MYTIGFGVAFTVHGEDVEQAIENAWLELFSEFGVDDSDRFWVDFDELIEEDI